MIFIFLKDTCGDSGFIMELVLLLDYYLLYKPYYNTMVKYYLYYFLKC